MNNVKGKLEYNQENMQLVLELVQNKDYCYGINDYGYICYMRFLNEKQLWAIVDLSSKEIRNAGLNDNGEHRVWHSSLGIMIDLSQSINSQIKNITFIQVFNAMRFYLINYWQKNKNSDIGMIITNFMLTINSYYKIYDLSTWDPPVKEDWILGVEKTFDELNISENFINHKYNEKQAFLCMKNYLQLFYENYSFNGVKALIEIINNVEIDSTEWQEWLKAIELAVIEEINLKA